MLYKIKKICYNNNIEKEKKRSQASKNLQKNKKNA